MPAATQMPVSYARVTRALVTAFFMRWFASTILLPMKGLQPLRKPWRVALKHMNNPWNLGLVTKPFSSDVQLQQNMPSFLLCRLCSLALLLHTAKSLLLSNGGGCHEERTPLLLPFISAPHVESLVRSKNMEKIIVNAFF